MTHERALRTRMLAIASAAALVVAVFMPLANAPAQAAQSDPANLMVSGKVVADPSAPPLPPNVLFDIALAVPGGGSQQTWHTTVQGTEFSVPAPGPGVYTLRVTPLGLYNGEFTPWAGAWLGDTPFEWNATEFRLAGTAPVTGLTVTMTKAASISGEINAPAADYNFGFTIDAFLLDPATGMYQHVSDLVRDFVGPYSIGNLPQGTYVVRFGHRGRDGYELRLYPSEYFGGSRYLDGAQQIEVTTGGELKGINAALDPWSFHVSRTAGADRYETAVRVSEGAFRSGVPAVYLASGAAWPDALSAAPAAAHHGGPLLLTEANVVPKVVLSELERLNPSEIIVAGGPAVISNAVIKSLEDKGYEVRRVAGVDRYDTSRKLALDAFGGAATQRGAWVATGHGFADALSAAADAGRFDIPLVLVDGAVPQVDASTIDALAELGVSKIYVAGGPAAINQRYFESLQSTFGQDALMRYEGVDRYETSHSIARRTKYETPSVQTGRAFFVSGTGFADALSAAPVAGLTSTPLLLTDGNCVSHVAVDTLLDLGLSQVELVGGTAVLGTGVENFNAC